MTGSSSSVRQIIGCFVPRYETQTTKPGVMFLSAKILLDEVLAGTPPPPRNLQLLIVAEASGRSAANFAGATLSFLTRDEIRNLIQKHAESAEGPDTNEHARTSAIFFFLGSREYCSLWIEYWARQRDGALAPWGIDLVAVLKRARPNQGFWCDSANNMQVRSKKFRSPPARFLY